MFEARALLETVAIRIVEDAPSVAIVRFRGADAASLTSLGDALGTALPDLPNTYARSHTVDVCWLAPGEWAVVGLPIETVRRAAGMQAPPCVHHVADMGGAWSRWRLTGASIGELLAKGCSIDLDPAVFSVGRCVRTLLGQVSVLLVRGDGGWDIFADRTLSTHLRAWFARAARGCAPSPEVAAP